MADTDTNSTTDTNTNDSQGQQTKQETFRVDGEQLLHKIKEIIAEGNARKITIKDKNGKDIIVLPLTLGVVGTVVAPVLAGLGAIAALIGECTISVERDMSTPTKEQSLEKISE